MDPADLEDVNAAGERTELTDLLDGVHRGLRDLSGIITATQLSLPGRCTRCPASPPPDGAVTSPEGHAATGSLTAPNTAIPTWSPAPTGAVFSLPATCRPALPVPRIAHRPATADSSLSRDVYGNISSYFHVTEPHRVLTVTSDSVVEVDPPPDELYGSGSAWAPWEDAALRRRTAHWPSSSPSTWIRRRSPTRYVTMRPELCSAASVDRRAARAELTHPRGLHLPLRRDDGVHRGPRDAGGARGVCQDFTRLAIACLRANGLAARYVSGYLATDPPPGKERMVGIDATHAWVEVWTPENRWLGMDPTNNQMVDERYIVVGQGRDYADVPPLRGIIYTNSENSEIDVAVDVVPCAGECCMRDFVCPTAVSA
ncbi:transglutaminase-like superfamily protein [Mycobacterium xenopi 4042]|uniref:Transglutaminase-like superfamily protein n=1 Tax=Mycobacterium xenopi 4042 TaxID=1299334 RepID=X8BKX8_MYCXE|nr:transglutaminase-like superfamily protein [Mycobacterium xenopi 4042]